MGIKLPKESIFNEPIKHFEYPRTAQANHVISEDSSKRINEFKRPVLYGLRMTNED